MKLTDQQAQEAARILRRLPEKWGYRRCRCFLRFYGYPVSERWTLNELALTERVSDEDVANGLALPRMTEDEVEGLVLRGSGTEGDRKQLATAPEEGK